MDLTRRSFLVYALLLAVWMLVAIWQVEEHVHFKEYAKTALKNRSKDIANTLGASIRGLQFRGAVFGDRLQPVLDELVTGRTNELVKSGEVLGIVLLNAAGEPVASAGKAIDLEQKDILQEGERWGLRSVTMVYPVEGASVMQEGVTNIAPVLLPPFTNSPREGGRPRREPRPPEESSSNSTTQATSNAATSISPSEAPPGTGEPRPRRPFWARRLNEQEYQSLIQKRELHGLVLAMSTDTFQAACLYDL